MPGGYILPVSAFEHELERALHIDGMEHSLPRIHDVHLVYKVENIQKASAVLGRSCRMEPCLSRHPRTLWVYWNRRKGKVKPLNGGFQESFDFGTHRITFQLFANGTVSVAIANSRTPFDPIGLKVALAAVDAVFLLRTGLSFWGVSDLFYFEQAHFSNDIVSNFELSGASSLNCTIKQLDDWLYRVYEKVLGGQLLLRSEWCLVKGRYEDHNVNRMLALIQGVMVPTVQTAKQYQTSRDVEMLTQDIRRQQNEIERVRKDLHHFAKGASRYQYQLRKAMEEALRLLGRLAAPGGRSAGQGEPIIKPLGRAQAHATQSYPIVGGGGQ